MKRLILCALFTAACGHGTGSIDKTEGAACLSDRDCDHLCYQGGHFPGGFCSVPCRTDLDCPDDSLCMSDSGGVCMFVCPPFDCARLGPGWSCRERDQLGGGHADVCSGD